MPVRPLLHALRPLFFAALLAFVAPPILEPRAAEVTGDPGAFGELIETGFENSTFHRATRPDPRFCRAPVCGGFFFERVNRKRTLCADGSKADECHAVIVDLSRPGLDAATESSTRFAAETASPTATTARGRWRVSASTWKAPAARRRSASGKPVRRV